jgi:hypothetical protein
MAQLQRIKGQEVEVLLLVDGEPQNSLSNVRSLTVTPRFELKEEQYLGETSMRFDEIFNGVSFSFSVHFGDAGVLDFMTVVKDRAERRLPGTIINMKATLNFPNGTRRKVILRDCFFGDMPIAFGSRSDYGEFSIDGRAQDIQLLG